MADTNVKVTKKDNFNEVIALALANDRADLVEFAKHEIELLDKKSSKSGNSKKSAEHSAIMDTLVSALAEVGRPITISDLANANAEVGGYTNQKLSAMFKKLVDEGRVVRTTDKKKAFFSLPSEEDADEVAEEI